MSGIIGLDYTTVLEMIKLYGIEDSVSMIEKLQVIEAGVLQVLNKEK